MLDTQNTQLPAPRVPVVGKLDQLMERSWYRFFSNLYNYFINLPYGSFYDTTTQSASANTPTAITFNSSADTRHTSISSSSRILFDADGLTTVTFSIQFVNPDSAEDDVYVWLRKNGVDVAYTASAVTVPKKHGSVDGTALMTVNFHETYGPGDYLELYWLTVNGTSTIATIPASLSPARPASPGVVLTVSQII
jgi:hypothetical protein